MRNTSALHWTLLVALLALPVVASAQDSTDDQEPVALHNLVISADGAWMAAEERSDQAVGNVRVWATESDVTFTIERGQNPRISRDSRWVSALQKPPLEDSGIVTPTYKRAGQTLVLLDTQDGSQRTFEFVLSHDWTYSYDETYTSMHLVYLQSPETKTDEKGPSKDEATKPAAKERKVGTLHLVHMTGEGDDRVWQNVTEYATYQRSRHVAYVVHDCQVVNHGHEGAGRDSLHIVGFSARNSGINAIYDGEKIEGLCWARDSLTLGFLDSTETTGNDGKRRVNSALYTWPSGQSFDTAQPLPRRWRQRFTRVRDISELRALHNLVISADGAWMAAEVRSDRGDRDVRVWSSEGDVTFSIERGQDPRISSDSCWVSALQKPPLKDSRTARPKNKRAGQTLVLLDTQDGSREAIDFVLSYGITCASTYLLYLQSPETIATENGSSRDEAAKPAAKERTMGTLHQVPLNLARLARILRPYEPDKVYTKEKVVEFVTHPTNDHFAYVFHDEETSGDTLHIIKWGIRAWYHGDTIEGLSWAGGADGGDDSIILGFLNSTETTGEDGKRRANSALYTWQPAQSSEEQFTRVDTPQ